MSECNHNCESCSKECQEREVAEGCTHDCSNCSSNCSSREYKKEDFILQPNPETHVKKIIAVVSGKGGVGKSLVTSLCAIAQSRNNKKVAIVDADVTGPSIAHIFGISQSLLADENYTYPAETLRGIKLVSTNLLLEDPTQPVVWRGPIIADLVKQFYQQVNWGDVDYMFVDCPPGTGDVPLTIFQSYPVDGIIVVTTPQDLVEMIVEKAVNMANMMDIPVLGIIENMSYLECDQCHKKLNVFGESHIQEFCDKHNIKLLAQLPIDPNYATYCDNGVLEDIDSEVIDQLQKILD